MRQWLVRRSVKGLLSKESVCLTGWNHKHVWWSNERTGRVTDRFLNSIWAENASVSREGSLCSFCSQETLIDCSSLVFFCSQKSGWFCWFKCHETGGQEEVFQNKMINSKTSSFFASHLKVRDIWFGRTDNSDPNHNYHENHHNRANVLSIKWRDRNDLETNESEQRDLQLAVNERETAWWLDRSEPSDSWFSRCVRFPVLEKSL